MPQLWNVDGLLDWLVQEAGLPPQHRPDRLDVTFEQIGLDSLAYLQLQAVVHDRFGVELPPDGPADYTLDVILATVNAAPVARDVA